MSITIFVSSSLYSDIHVHRIVYNINIGLRRPTQICRDRIYRVVRIIIIIVICMGVASGGGREAAVPRALTLAPAIPHENF